MPDANAGAPVEFETVVVCDLIRQENTGKHILIGVYAINIGVQGFPVDMRLSWWMIVRPRRAGEHKANFRILGPHDATLVQGQFGMNIKEIKKAAVLRLDNVQLQLQAEGDIKLQIQFPDMDWQTIKEIDIVQRIPRVLVVPSPSP